MNKVEPINAYEALNEIIEAQRQTIQSLTAVIVELEKLLSLDPEVSDKDMYENLKEEVFFRFKNAKDLKVEQYKAYYMNKYKLYKDLLANLEKAKMQTNRPGGSLAE